VGELIEVRNIEGRIIEGMIIWGIMIWIDRGTDFCNGTILVHIQPCGLLFRLHLHVQTHVHFHVLFMLTLVP
jgi:hypothetical protein